MQNSRQLHGRIALSIAAPGCLEPVDLFVHRLNRDSTTRGERSHPRNSRIEVAKVALPNSGRRKGEIKEPTSCLADERDPRTRSFGILIQFEFEIGFQVLVPISQSWQGESPQVDSGQKVFAKAAILDGIQQVAVRSGDQLKVAVRFTIRAERQEGPQQL